VAGNWLNFLFFSKQEWEKWFIFARLLSMEELLFKRNLLKLQKRLEPKTFAQALIGTEFGDWSFVHQNPLSAPVQSIIQEVEKVISEEEPKDLLVNTKALTESKLTEKRVVLESLNQFTEKIKQSGKSKLEFPGGEIVIGSEKNERKELVLKSNYNLDQLMDFYLKNNLEHFHLPRVSKLKQSTKIMFVLEKVWTKQLYSSVHQNYEELKYLLEESTAILLARMIDAMKLAQSDFFISAVEIDGATEQVLLDEINLIKPQIVVTFGAVATQSLLMINERLHHIHGKFFNRTLISNEQRFDFQVVPLFHPDFLRINPKMKATAWQDMQLIMKKIEKA
jgi:hypothetical protein